VVAFVLKFMVIKALSITLNKPLSMPLRLKNDLAPLLRAYDTTLLSMIMWLIIWQFLTKYYINLSPMVYL
jgi:hypothetical protein